MRRGLEVRVWAGAEGGSGVAGPSDRASRSGGEGVEWLQRAVEP